ncbi:MAG: hypothetical protein WB424_06525 [Terracidiphilus sp.]
MSKLKQATVSRFCFQLSICLFCVLLSSVRCDGQKPHLTTGEFHWAFVRFLQNKMGDPQDEAVKTTRYSSVIIRSDGVTKDEIIVYISDGGWCGSGGCRLLILEPDDTSFNVIGDLSIVQLPIRVLRTRSHGHFDLGVWVQGGGIQPGHEAILRFDGKSYPRNPSIAPAQPLTKRVAGDVLIARGVEGELLYK